MSEIINSYIPNVNEYKRKKLVEQLPLDTPFSLEIFPYNACNLQCVFCGRSSKETQYLEILNSKRVMDLDMYEKCIEDCKNFSRNIKSIHFTGFGEPILHPNIGRMVKKAVESGIAEKVDITTNGVGLTQNVSDAIIDANPFLIKVSINGLSDEAYKKTCGVDVNFKQLVQNIKYFYENRKDTLVYVKIMDYMIESPEDKKLFYDTFEGISDSISVEYLTHLAKGINYDEIAKADSDRSMRGFDTKEYNICPHSYYYMRINPDGKVYPCFEPSTQIAIGDINTEKITDIWNGEKLKNFRLKMINGVKRMNDTCRSCQIYKYGIYSEDVLDGYENQLLNIYRDTKDGE